MASDNYKNYEGKLWQPRGKSYYSYEIKTYYNNITEILVKVTLNTKSKPNHGNIEKLG